jgi:predicted phosphodiesterase
MPPMTASTATPFTTNAPFTSGYSQIITTASPVAGYFTTPGPQGNKFSDSRRMKSADEIRSEYNARLYKLQMPEVCDISLPRPRHGKHVTIIHAGDVHIGTDACTYRAFKELLEYVLQAPDTYIAFQGDLVDVLTAHSVGVMAEQAMTIQEQFTLATADLMPLAKANKILWVIKGNHEDRLDRATKNIVDGAQWMARVLDVNYLYTEGYTRLHCGDASYLSYNLHGFNAGSSAGARRNKMDSMLTKFPSADIITCGHNHQLDIIQRVDDTILPNNQRAHKQRWGLYTGTFHSYIGYPAEAGLGASPLGATAVHFDIEFNTIKPEILPVVPINGVYRIQLPVR